MESTRRTFFKMIAMGAAGMVVDPELLLWKPGAKTIFLPPTGMTMAQVIDIEMARIIPRIRDLFERDDLFYSAIKSGKNATMTVGRDMSIPIIVTDGD